MLLYSYLAIFHLFLGFLLPTARGFFQGEQDACHRDDASHRGQRGGRSVSHLPWIASAGRRLVVRWTVFLLLGGWFPL